MANRIQHYDGGAVTDPQRCKLRLECAGVCSAEAREVVGKTMSVQEVDCVILTQDLADEDLVAGDIGTVVHIHQSGAGYEVEFMTLAGETVAVTTLLPSQLRPIARRDVANVRELTPA